MKRRKGYNCASLQFCTLAMSFVHAKWPASKTTDKPSHISRQKYVFLQRYKCATCNNWIGQPFCFHGICPTGINNFFKPLDQIWGFLVKEIKKKKQFILILLLEKFCLATLRFVICQDYDYSVVLIDNWLSLCSRCQLIINIGEVGSQVYHLCNPFICLRKQPNITAFCK